MRAPQLFPTMRGYQSQWLGPDVLAGLTLVAIAVPEQMATVGLANVTAVTGLYAFIAGTLVFAALGRDGHLSVGADSTIAPVMAAGVAAVAVVGSPHYRDLVSFLAIMVGALIVAIGLLRLGWIAEFLSTPVITGILAGIAVEILVRQLPVIGGLAGGGTTTLARLRRVGSELAHVNTWSMGIALAVFAVIMAAEHVNRRVPGALIGLVGSTVAVAAGGLKAHGVAVLGAIHGGLPTLALPSASWSDAGRLVLPALTVAFVCVAQTAATVRASSAGAPAARDFNRDLVALGAGSLVAGVSRAFAVDSSPPRTEVVRASGGRTQLTGIVAAVVALVVVLVATGLLQDLPRAALGAILVFVATRLFRIPDFRAILRFDVVEFALAVVTLLAVALFGIEVGRGRGARPFARRSDPPGGPTTRRDPRTGAGHRSLDPPRRRATDRAGARDHRVPPATRPRGTAMPTTSGCGCAGSSTPSTRRCTASFSTSTPCPTSTSPAPAALGDLTAELKARGVTLAIARASHLVHHDLKHSGLLQTIGPDRLFATVEDAVSALAGGN